MTAAFGLFIMGVGMDIPLAVQGLMQSLNALTEYVKSMRELKEGAGIAAATSNLMGMLFDAQRQALQLQTEHSALLREKEDLEKCLMRMREFEEEKQRYGLQEIAPGTFAYAVKPGHQGSDPPHNLCPTCYQQGVKSILQGIDPANGRKRWHCHRCNSTLLGESILNSILFVKKSDPLSGF